MRYTKVMLLVVLSMLVIFVSCSQVDDVQDNPMASISQDTITSVEGKKGAVSTMATSTGSSMNVSWPFYNWSSSSGWTIYSNVPTHVGADQYSLDISKWNCYGIGVYAGIAGRVVEATSGCNPNDSDGCNSCYGNTVVVYDNSRHVAVRYSHLSFVAVNENDNVSYRQYIGKIGNSGCSSGAHLHITAYENINDNNGNPIIPNASDGTYYSCEINWSF